MKNKLNATGTLLIEELPVMQIFSPQSSLKHYALKTLQTTGLLYILTSDVQQMLLNTFCAISRNRAFQT